MQQRQDQGADAGYPHGSPDARNMRISFYYHWQGGPLVLHPSIAVESVAMHAARAKRRMTPDFTYAAETSPSGGS